jgi:hypothetical protein
MGKPSCAQNPVIIKATECKGGGLDPYYAHYFDRFDVNAIYSAPSKEKSVLTATFSLTAIPQYPSVQIEAHGDEDASQPCKISILINDQVIFTGDAAYLYKWEVKEYPIPGGLLKPGVNSITIINEMEKGVAGNVPWLMIYRAAIGERGFELEPANTIFRNFYVKLPGVKKEIPEPLKNGEKPGFSLRGTKGWNWTPEQTLKEIPYFKKFRFNFYMNCYTSMFDFPNRNEWWKPLPPKLISGYEEIVKQCRANGIEFCFSLNPNFMADKEFNYDDREHIEIIWAHYKWMAGLGVNWFCVSLDDISKGLDAGGQARFVNLLLKRLKKLNPEAKMILCPTVYATAHYEGNDDNINYLRQLAKELDPEVYCFYTGLDFCGPVTTEKTREFKDLINHRIIIWDNYPVNDGMQSMNLGPLVLRDKDLCTVADGYMANPMKTQSEFSRIALNTCADYAWNPKEYDPERSIGQTILNLTDSPEQAKTLKDATDIYFGCFIGQSDHYWYARNPARVSFEALTKLKHSYVPAHAFVENLKRVQNDLKRYFPGMYVAECQTIQIDIDWMENQMNIIYP